MPRMAPQAQAESTPHSWALGKTLALWIKQFVNAIEELNLIVFHQVLLIDGAEAVATIKELAEPASRSSICLGAPSEASKSLL